ncbi:MAG: ABC transporter substrate-binding protein [Alphaproteobacteria bacterium]|nr:ABC transporter substrate-binding protein [Alphaproteobacteria bacterium]
MFKTWLRPPGVAVAAVLAVAAATWAPAQAQQANRTFTMATALTDSKFDPALHFAEFDGVDIINSYEPLVFPVKGQLPKPWLATSWTTSPDGKKWTFKLRGDVKFHDGKPLTANDVVYSMDRMLTIGKGYASLWDGILKPGTTKAIDATTVEFNLEQPFGPFTETLVQFYIVNSELLKANTKGNDWGQAYLQNNSAGSGPYKLESVVPDRRRVFVKHDDYRGGWTPNHFDRVVIEIIKEGPTARALMLDGKVDFIDQWRTPDFYPSMAKEKGVRVMEAADNKLYYIQFNNQRAPFDDENFRKAVSLAIDYETIAKDIMGGAEVGSGPIPSAMLGYDSSTPKAKRDLAKAKEYLAKSKYKPDQFELEYSFLKVSIHEPVGLLVQANLKELGIPVKIKTDQWPVLAAAAAKKETAPHFFAVFNTAKYPTPDAYTFAMYHPSNHGGWQAASHYNNPETTKMLETARTTIDTVERNKKYAAAAKKVVDEAVSAWVGYPMHRTVVSERVKNYESKGLMAFDLYVYDLRI